jgi:hypothetical protein
MPNQSDRTAVSEALERINRTWLEGRPHDLAPLVHPGIVMVVPSLNARAEGSDAFVAGFVDFCDNAELQEYGESDLQVDVTGDSGVATFAFDMVYKRGEASYRSTGRDLWVFARQDDAWLAVWRTMFDLNERPV